MDLLSLPSSLPPIARGIGFYAEDVALFIKSRNRQAKVVADEDDFLECIRSVDSECLFGRGKCRML